MTCSCCCLSMLLTAGHCHLCTENHVPDYAGVIAAGVGAEGFCEHEVVVHRSLQAQCSDAMRRLIVCCGVQEGKAEDGANGAAPGLGEAVVVAPQGSAERQQIGEHEALLRVVLELVIACRDVVQRQQQHRRQVETGKRVEK